jgi:N-methylhydantoinase A/acetophenone carboxylase
MFTADVDVGGTFTDGFFTDGANARTAKVLTTPHDLTECFLDCLAGGARAFGVGLPAFLAQSLVVRLSTTLGTNTLIQRRGPRIGLLVTRGATETLYGAGRSALLDALVPADMVVGIGGAADATGRVAEPVDRDEVLAAVRLLVNRGARLIGVSLRGAWQQPELERQVRELVRERYPSHYLRSIPLQLGTEVSASADDHARTNTLVLNAYLHADLARGLYRAEDRAREQGLRHPLLVVHASGACARVAKTVAVQTLSSGPAVAIRGAAQLARLLGLERVLTMDMGGTSLDVAVLDGLDYPVVERPLVAGVPVAVPMIQAESIGAGGGSIARVEDGAVQVGPRSAGSAPGPACYDRGGLEPTVTDADLVLGYLDADYFLGGRMRLNRKRAEDAIGRRLARPLQCALEEAAHRVRERVEATMTAEVAGRLRGDPSAYTLFAFGGAGPLHAVGLAARVGIHRVVVFPFGSVFSAFGSSTADVVHSATVVRDLDLADLGRDGELAALVAELRDRTRRDMRGEGFEGAALTFELSASGCVGDRSIRLVLPLPADEPIDAAAIVDGLRTKAGASRATAVWVEALTVSARAPVPHWLPPPREAGSGAAPVPKGERPACWDPGQGWIATAIYERDALPVGGRVSGPAVIEAPDTATLVPAGWQAAVDRYGNLVIEQTRLA